MPDSDNPLGQLERNPKKIAWETARQLLHYIASEWNPVEEEDAETPAMLVRRARLLAKPPEEAAVSAKICRALLFALGGERYAVQAESVRAVTVLTHITPVPCTPGFYLGVVNVRGNVISAIDLRLLFGILVGDAEREPGEGALVVVEGAGLEISFLADEVLGVVDVPWSSLSLPSEALIGISPDYIAGTTAEGVILLDLEALFADDRLIVNEEVV